MVLHWKYEDFRECPEMVQQAPWWIPAWCCHAQSRHSAGTPATLSPFCWVRRPCQRARRCSVGWWEGRDNRMQTASFRLPTTERAGALPYHGQPPATLSPCCWVRRPCKRPRRCSVGCWEGRDNRMHTTCFHLPTTARAGAIPCHGQPPATQAPARTRGPPVASLA